MIYVCKKSRYRDFIGKLAKKIDTTFKIFFMDLFGKCQDIESTSVQYYVPKAMLVF